MAWTLLKYLSPLKGKKIVGVAVSKDGSPLLRLDNGWEIEISADPEGNGPGFIHGLPCLTEKEDAW